jgi:hypothetical protein
MIGLPPSRRNLTGGGHLHEMSFVAKFISK